MSNIYRYQIAQKLTALPDGKKGGDGVAVNNAQTSTVAATGETATGYGNGGGAAAAYNRTVSGGVRAISGAGSGGVIFLYARRKRKVSEA